MSTETGGKPKANNLAKLLRFVDGVVNGGSTQPLRVSEKTFAIARRLFAVAPHKGHNPSIALQRQHDRAKTSLGGRVKRGHGFTICRRIIRNGEDRRGIGDIDPDGGLFRRRLADGFKKTKSEIAAPRGLDNQIRGENFARPAAVLKADGRNRAAIGRRNKPLNPAMLTDKDIGVLVYAPSHGQL